MTYDKTFFDAGIDRKGTRCEKWDGDVCPQGTVPMWVADMDFPCAQPIQEAILSRAAHPCYGYTMVEKDDAEAFCSFMARRHGVTISPDQTSMLPCVVTGLRTCVRAYTNEGDHVAILTPVYGPFYRAIEENHRVVDRCPLVSDAQGRYHMDFDKIEAVLRSGDKLFMLCSPHNPVSRLWSAEELRTLLSLTRKYHAMLVVDEIHAEFVYAPHEFTSILSIAEDTDDVLCLLSASKTFNIAGLQQAMAVSRNADIMAAIARELCAAGAVSGNIFALEATRAAYTKCDDWLDGLLVYLKNNAQILKEELARCLPKAVLTPVEATYLAWIDLRAYFPTTDELMKKCREHGVAFTGGTYFGAEGEGFIRFNFGCPEDQLREAVRRMAEAMTK